MATWKNIITTSYNGSDNHCNLSVSIQYDADSVTTTSMKCRAVGTPTKGTSTDTYFVYSNGGGISKICYLSGSSSAYTSTNFYLSKDQYSDYFSLPALKICNDGHHRDKSAYTDSNGRGYEVYWTSSRGSWSTTMNASGTKVSTSVYVYAVTGGKVEVKDNNNNSFSLVPTAATGNAYNSVDGYYDLKWGYTSNNRETAATANTAIPLTISGTGDTRNVYARVTSNAKYLDPPTAYGANGITQYIAPGNPGKPALTDSSYKNRRLTVKQDWTYTWDAATPGNATTSPVKGYLLYFYVDGVRKKIKLSSDGTELEPDTASNAKDYVYYEKPARSITIKPTEFGISAGNTVKLGIYAYSKNGKGQIDWSIGTTKYHLWSGNATTEIQSDISTVQNAGVVRVKTKNSNNTVTWKEGVVWVKVKKNNVVQWVEADVVKTKTKLSNGSIEWKESV